MTSIFLLFGAAYAVAVLYLVHCIRQAPVIEEE